VRHLLGQPRLIGILHIGAEKTGTTTLQEFCFLNRDRLAASGVLYPRTPGAKQHSLLALYAMDDGRENLLTRRMAAALAPGRDRWRAALRGQIAAEVATTVADRLLISSELFHSQLVSTDEIARLKGLLDSWCDRYMVVFYMRRQDRAQVSRYSTDLRTGGTPLAMLPERSASTDLYDYARVLARWSAVFGRASIVPRVFEPAALKDRDLIADFMDAGDLPALADLQRPPRRNEALSAAAQRLLLAYNRNRAALAPLPEPRSAQLQRIVAAFVERSCPGQPALPARAQALAFHESFREGNRQVAREWFGREQLFEEDFSDYPERADPMPPPDAGEAMGLAAGLAQHLMANAVWLDSPRLQRLSTLSAGHNLTRVLAEYLREHSPDLAERVAALPVSGQRR